MSIAIEDAPKASVTDQRDWASPDPPNSQQTVWRIFWFGLLAATLPLASVYFLRMWDLTHYQYFPFAIGSVAYLAYLRSDRLFRPPATFRSLAILLLGLVPFAIAVYMNSPWMMIISFVLFATSCLTVMRGPADRSLGYLALPLFLLIRLPLNYDQRLIIELQRLTTRLSSLLLDVVAIPHAVARNVIQLADRELFVAEACSGIQSVFTLAFLSTLLVVVYRRRLWLAPFYLIISGLLAAAGNVLRVTTVALVSDWFELDWAEGWEHEMLGYTTLAISGLFLLSFDRLIVTLLHPMPGSSGASQANPFVTLWNGLVSDGRTVDAVDDYLESRARRVAEIASQSQTGWLGDIFSRLQNRTGMIAFAAFASILFVASLSQAFKVPVLDFKPKVFADGLIFDPPNNLLDNFKGEFRLTNTEKVRGGENPILGMNADLWEYSRRLPGGQEISGQFVISQAYEDYHELCDCYDANEWILDYRQVRDGVDEDTLAMSDTDREVDRNDSYAFAFFKKSNQSAGHLWYAAIDSTGQVIRPPASTGDIGMRFNDLIQPTTKARGPILMTQLWIVTPEKLNNSVAKSVSEDFTLIRQRIATFLQARETSAGQESLSTTVGPVPASPLGQKEINQ